MLLLFFLIRQKLYLIDRGVAIPFAGYIWGIYALFRVSPRGGGLLIRGLNVPRTPVHARGVEWDGGAF